MTLGPIGLVQGPGEGPHRFRFVAPDREGRLRIGEFVAYRTRVDGADRQVLARIVERMPLRTYPLPLLGDPQQNPQELARTVGYEGQGSDRFLLEAEVVGYYHEGMQEFVNPRLLPHAGDPVYPVPDEELARVLSRVPPGDPGALTVGSLLYRAPDAVPVALDLDTVASTHLAILASTGAGKSYTAAVLLEEMLHPRNRAAVLIVDPHGEYDTLQELEKHPDFQDGEYRPRVRIYRYGDRPEVELKMRLSYLHMGDFRYLLPNLSDRMEYVLNQALRRLRARLRKERGREAADEWTFNQLLEVLGEMEEEGKEDGRGGGSGSIEAVRWRLEHLWHNTRIFDDTSRLKLQELFRPGQATILDVSQVDEREQQVMVAILLRKLFEARTRTEQGKAIQGHELHLPYPVFVLLEEAHRFAPHGGDAVSSGILKTILAEGRKFGIGVGLISQRPGKLDGDVLSQCNTQILLRIVNPVDQAKVAEGVESVGRELLRELPALSKGQAILAGAALPTPVLVRVRPRRTRHGGAHKPPTREWRRYFSDMEVQARKRDQAPSAELNRFRRRDRKYDL